MKTALFLIGIMAGLAASAHADISDSGNLIIGGQGIMGGTMTVQGSAFSVGGSTFVVAGGSVTLGGALNAAAAGIKWADGSTSTTAATGGSAVAASTFTRLTTEQTTTSTSWVSITGSTLTLTMSGGRALMGFSCQFDNNSTGNCVGLGALVNGGFIDGESAGGAIADGGLNRHCSPAANRGEMGGFVHLTENTHSGNTTFSLIWRVDGTTGRMNHSGASACQFFVTEQ